MVIYAFSLNVLIPFTFLMIYFITFSRENLKIRNLHRYLQSGSRLRLLFVELVTHLQIPQHKKMVGSFTWLHNHSDLWRHC